MLYFLQQNGKEEQYNELMNVKEEADPDLTEE